jgi:hypothetical protein
MAMSFRDPQDEVSELQMYPVFSESYETDAEAGVED